MNEPTVRESVLVEALDTINKISLIACSESFAGSDSESDKKIFRRIEYLATRALKSADQIVTLHDWRKTILERLTETLRSIRRNMENDHFIDSIKRQMYLDAIDDALKSVAPHLKQ